MKVPECTTWFLACSHSHKPALPWVTQGMMPPHYGTERHAAQVAKGLRLTPAQGFLPHMRLCQWYTPHVQPIPLISLQPPRTPFSLVWGPSTPPRSPRGKGGNAQGWQQGNARWW